MTEETIENIGDYELPYGRKLNLKSIRYETGLDLIRMTFREKTRFTTVDLDRDSVEELIANLKNWLQQPSNTAG